MKKRLLSFLLACTLAVSMLAGCGSEKTNTGEADKDAVSDVDGEAAADEDFENNESEEIATEEEEEFFTISTYTLANRELHDFFQLYLGSWCKYGLGYSREKPNTIAQMLNYVSLFEVDDLRVMDGYSHYSFGGIYDGLPVGSFSSVSSAEYSCSVNIIDTNFGSEYIYREGTNAILIVLAEVTYNIEKYFTNGKSDTLTFEKPYIVELVKSTANTDEWLFRGITAALKYDTGGYTTKSLKAWKDCKGQDLINEDLIDVVDWSEVEQAYEEYVLANDVPLYKCCLMYLNEDAIPELLIQKEEKSSLWINPENVILFYKDGNIYESSSFEVWGEESGSSAMYQKYGNLFYVYSRDIGTNGFAIANVRTVFEVIGNDLVIKSQASEYAVEQDDKKGRWLKIGYRIDGVEYSEDEYSEDEFQEKIDDMLDMFSDAFEAKPRYTSIHEAFAESNLYLY